MAYFLGHPVYRTQKTSSKQCTRKPKAAIKQQKLLYSIYWGVFIHGIFAANFARNFCGSSRCGQFKFVYQQMLNAIAIADMYFCETSWFRDWCDMALQNACMRLSAWRAAANTLSYVLVYMYNNLLTYTFWIRQIQCHCCWANECREKDRRERETERARRVN